jgi:hypothetical protein
MATSLNVVVLSATVVWIKLMMWQNIDKVQATTIKLINFSEIGLKP